MRNICTGITSVNTTRYDDEHIFECRLCGTADVTEY